MLNGIWAGMILIGIIWAALHGTMAEVGNYVLEAASGAVDLCITMAGILAMWSGLMEIAQKAGILERIAEKMNPLLRLLFPKIPEGHPAKAAIAANFTANLLGLGWAATPAGLRAMEELAKLEEERSAAALPKENRTASDEMCTFLILNISSLQLIPVSTIAYRSQYGSADPAGILAPAIAATFASTIAAVVFCCVMRRVRKQEE